MKNTCISGVEDAKPTDVYGASNYVSSNDKCKNTSSLLSPKYRNTGETLANFFRNYKKTQTLGPVATAMHIIAMQIITGDGYFPTTYDSYTMMEEINTINEELAARIEGYINQIPQITLSLMEAMQDLYGANLARATLLMLLAMCTFQLLNEGWGTNKHSRTPRNRQHRITLGNGIFGTIKLIKFITRHSHCIVSGSKPRGKRLSLKNKEALLPWLEEKLKTHLQTEDQGKEGHGKHLNNTELIQWCQGGEIAGNPYPRLQATCRRWHKQLNTAAMNHLKQEVDREKDTERREKRALKREMQQEAKAKATNITPTAQKMGGSTWAEVARTKKKTPQTPMHIHNPYNVYFEPQQGVSCVVHSFNMAMGEQLLTTDQLMRHCHLMAEQGTHKMDDLHTHHVGFSVTAL